MKRNSILEEGGKEPEVGWMSKTFGLGLNNFIK